MVDFRACVYQRIRSFLLASGLVLKKITQKHWPKHKRELLYQKCLGTLEELKKQGIEFEKEMFFMDEISFQYMEAKSRVIAYMGFPAKVQQSFNNKWAITIALFWWRQTGEVTPVILWSKPGKGEKQAHSVNFVGEDHVEWEEQNGVYWARIRGKGWMRSGVFPEIMHRILATKPHLSVRCLGYDSSGTHTATQPHLREAVKQESPPVGVLLIPESCTGMLSPPDAAGFGNQTFKGMHREEQFWESVDAVFEGLEPDNVKTHTVTTQFL